MAREWRITRRVLKALGYGGLAVVVLLFAVALGARFADGPIGLFPGGALHGPIEDAPVRDWSFAADHRTLELQVDPTRPRSVTTWLLVHDGVLYVPSGFAAQKTWPGLAVRDPHVVVRIDGRLYPCRARRVEEPALRVELLAALAQKYELGEVGDTAEGTWLFELRSDRD
jgi:hypothetical protein